MNNFTIPKKTARLVVLQRIEVASPFLLKIRKIFGRYIFSNFVTKYFLNINFIEKKYYEIMDNEFSTIEKFIEKTDKLILSIGGGIGGLELIINQKLKDKNFFLLNEIMFQKRLNTVGVGWSMMKLTTT